MLTKIQPFSSLQDALDALFGSGTKVVQAQYTAGGDINEARRLTLNNGMPVFMKANAKKNLAFFTAEAAGLAAIAHTGTVSVPRVLCCGTDDAQGGCSFADGIFRKRDAQGGLLGSAGTAACGDAPRGSVCMDKGRALRVCAG